MKKAFFICSGLLHIILLLSIIFSVINFIPDKCDTEKQSEFFLKCIAINHDNKDQAEVVAECRYTASEMFCKY